MAKKERNRHDDHSGIISIIIVALILISGITFTFILMNRDSDDIIEKPEVSVSVGVDNPVMFTVKMSFEGDVSALDAMSNSEYQLIVSEALNSIGYEKLTSEKSVDYLKDEMKKRISEKLKTNEDFDISTIYVDKFTENKYTPFQEKNSNKDDKVHEDDIPGMFKFK